MNILPFDEINALIRQDYSEFSVFSAKTKKEDVSRKIADELLEYLIFAYLTGISRTAEDLGVDIEDDIDEMYEIIFTRIGGETFEDRVDRWVREDDEGRLGALAESEAHRVCETASWRGAGRASQEYGIEVGKRWDTMLDDRVRDTHEYLEGRIVPLNEEFYTYDGDHAQYPGGFQNVSENVNCRCHVEYVNLGQGSPKNA